MRRMWWVVVLLLGCRTPSTDHPSPAARGPQGGTAGPLLELEKPGFFFVHQVEDRWFLGLTHQIPDADTEEAAAPKPAWTFSAADLSEPEVISASYFIAVTRKIGRLPDDLAALQGRRVAVYHGTTRVCETTVSRVLALNQFQVREPEEYGMPSQETLDAKPDTPLKDHPFTPKYPEIFRESTFSVAAELAPCTGIKTPGGAALWARSVGLKAPDFWPRDPSADWQRRVSSWLEKQEAWKEIQDFKEENSSEKPLVSITGWRRDPNAGVVKLEVSIGDPGIRHGFVLIWDGKDFRAVHESTSPGAVTFVADLDDDGRPELVFSPGGSNLDRRLVRIEQGAWKVLSNAGIVNLSPESN